MDDRDRFAMAALTGLLARAHGSGFAAEQDAPEYATRAYAFADAMLDVRARDRAEALRPCYSCRHPQHDHLGQGCLTIDCECGGFVLPPLDRFDAATRHLDREMDREPSRQGVVDELVALGLSTSRARALVMKMSRGIEEELAAGVSEQAIAAAIATSAPLDVETLCDHPDCDGETVGEFVERPGMPTDAVRCARHPVSGDSRG